MNYKKSITNLEEDLFDDIMKMSESELDAELNELGVDTDKKLSSYRDIVQTNATNLKKKTLEETKERLSEYKKSTAQKTDIIQILLSRGIDLKQYLIELYVQGKVPQGLTVAFRDGKDISDEEAASIIANLSELGEIDLND